MQDGSKVAADVKEAWNALPPDERARVEPELRSNHDALLSIRAGVAPASRPTPEMALAYSLLHDDPDGLLIDTATGRIETSVGPDGQVYWGGVDYDATDYLGWGYCPIAWHLTEGKTPAFSNTSATIEIANTVTIALLGDWGGNNKAAQDVASSARAAIGAGDIMVHLGDVYYAGTDESGWVERDYQMTHFLAPWPWSGTQGKSFALNSNHDMYAHGTGYFNTALTSPIFASQNRCSYFALYNDRFRIVGLDTAYFDPDQSGFGFMTGSLGPTGPGTQAQFLNDQARAAAAAKQQLILLTHHNGLQYDGSAPISPLWDQVVAQLAPLSGGTVIWYWGHEHMGVVYKDRNASGITIRPRCCGHGCIPWGVATRLNSPDVEWYEKTVLGPGSNYFVANGFATVALDGYSISETIFRQDGTESWPTASSASWPS
ncbi:MAG: metallophosphoesterase [Solirubrobacteraceae bacterium]